MLLADQPTTWTMLGLALLALAALLGTEWRRADRRRRPARVGATIVAVAALAVWALRPAWHESNLPEESRRTTAALWTAGTAPALPAPTEVEARYRFALPGANLPAGSGATFLPDAATWRRRSPEVSRLRILGDGLDPADLPSLDGLQVDFVSGPRATAIGLSFLSLRCPRVLLLGETLTVEGQMGDLPAGQTAVLALEAPDGTSTEAATATADANGVAGFALRMPSPPAAGRFPWRLRLKPASGENVHAVADETLGVEVLAPTLPRVLVLESAPQFDATLLRHWYEEADGTLCERVRVGQDRYRFFNHTPLRGGATPVEFNALDAPLLAGFDLVLADARALASLPAPEREILRAAVAETGLGVLALADDAILPPATVAPDRAWMFPWQLHALDTADGTQRLARLLWAGLAQPADLPLPTAPFEIVPGPGQAAVVRDDQGRALAATASLGRGTLALTLVRETGRWTRANEPGAFAAYWSSLFARTARPLESPGRWTLAGGDDGPVFVDEPLELLWNGPPPGTVEVTDESGARPVTLPPESDPDESGRWRTRFWPRRAGWHRVEAKGGTLDFYVSPAGSWPELRAERRRTATERFAARSVAAPARPGPTEPALVPAGWWFGAFLAGAGFLWVERRLAGR